MKKVSFPKKKPISPNTAWKFTFGKVVTPLEQFIKAESSSGILLVICTVIALFLANSSFFSQYQFLLSEYWTIGSPNFNISMSLSHWINDGLMTFFFFLVGLEIKREVLVGELSEFKKALLPILAAVGGMVVPALFYVMFNLSDGNLSGWAVPMATDIAFAVTALVLLGSKIPKVLITFLIALAIVDDIGGVLIIALFYSNDLHLDSLLIALGIFVLLMTFNYLSVRKTWVYALGGFVMWYFMHHSGVHATIAGVLTAMTVPARPRYQPKVFLYGARQLLTTFKARVDRNQGVLKDSQMVAILQTLKNGVHKSQTPLQLMEHAHHFPVNYLIIPIFALANAGIPIVGTDIVTTLIDPIALGIMMGLILGKPIGVVLCVWLSIKLGFCQLPKDVSYLHILGAGCLAGIGFTMSIFITELGFSNLEEIVVAKTAILFASIIAALVGFALLSKQNKKTNK